MPFNIVSIGMISPIGHDVITSCASFRAGLSRLAELRRFSEPGPEGEAPVINGHEVRNYTEGFEQPGRWIRLAQVCVRDMIAYGNLPDVSDRAYWENTGFMVALPILEEDRFHLPQDDDYSSIISLYVQPLIESLGLPISASSVKIVEGGHSSIGEILVILDQIASSDNVSFERYIILAADSMVDPQSISWASQLGILKSSTEASDGMFPGESAACLMIEDSRRPKTNHSTPLSVISGFALMKAEGEDEDPIDPTVIGSNLAEVVGSVLKQETEPFKGDIYLDLNGEEWKSLVWGNAQYRLHSYIDFEDVSFVVPSTSLGEIGAASGAVDLCLSTQAFLRSYSRSSKALICSINDVGDVAVVLVRRQLQVAKE